MVDQHLNVNKFLLFLMTFFAQIENAVLKAEHFCKIFTQNNLFYTIRNQPDRSRFKADNGKLFIISTSTPGVEPIF